MNRKSYRILAKNCFQSNNTWETGLNNNDIIIGTSGCGKTRGYVMPNLLQCTESVVVVDTKGRLYKDLGGILRRKGYEVIMIDFTDCAASAYGYNPLRAIRRDKDTGCILEQDILTVAACLIPLSPHCREPFWEISARMYVECMIAYVLEFLPENEWNLSSVIRLMEEKTYGECFDELLREVEVLCPDCFAAHRYRMIEGNKKAEKMDASINGILAAHLSPMSFSAARMLFQMEPQICFEKWGERKTAVFVNVSDTDRSLDALVNLFYTQALQSLCWSADKQPDFRLKIPVRFIFDDFASNTVIPDFDKIISVIRSREISVSLIIQSLSQLEDLYGSAKAKTIMNNCDNCLYLGGQDVATAAYMATKADKLADKILNMSLDEAWLFTRGQSPRQVQKFDLKQDGQYYKMFENQEDKSKHVLQKESEVRECE